MDLSTIAMALATILGRKVVEKTGENIGQVIWDTKTKLIKYLKEESPDTVTAIENIEKVPEKALDYSWIVLQMQKAANNPDVARTIQELAKVAEADQNLKLELAEILKKIDKDLKDKKSSMPKLEKLAEKIGQVVMEGGTGTIQNQTF
jgi:predicted transcriptional regulator